MTDFRWKSKKEANEFFSVVRSISLAPALEERERVYKLQLAAELQAARHAVRSNSPKWRGVLIRALESPRNNIINWRQRNVLCDVVSQGSRELFRSLDALWSGTGHLTSRVDRFGEALASVGLTQTGAQLTISSTLLMALGAPSHPPIRTEAFKDLFKRTGFAEGFDTALTAGGRYALAVTFLDRLLAEARHQRISLRDRLDAQGVVWCIHGGWWLEDEDESRVDEYLEAPELFDAARLTRTQREAVTQVRLGQNQFRENLLEFWGGCAVTGCSHPNLLRASHLKPWRESTDNERINPFNGLLLSPNLDCALDRGLISFRHDGRIMLSSHLSRGDRQALGLSGTLKLRRQLHQRHKGFLKYHREHVFEKS